LQGDHFPTSAPSNGVVFQHVTDNSNLMAFLNLSRIEHALLARSFAGGEPETDDGMNSFDERWYLHTNPDVAAAVRAGIFESGRQHNSLHGRSEGRKPRP